MLPPSNPIGDTAIRNPKYYRSHFFKKQAIERRYRLAAVPHMMLSAMWSMSELLEREWQVSNPRIESRIVVSSRNTNNSN